MAALFIAILYAIIRLKNYTIPLLNSGSNIHCHKKENLMPKSFFIPTTSHLILYIETVVVTGAVKRYLTFSFDVLINYLYCYINCIVTSACVLSNNCKMI